MLALCILLVTEWQSFSIVDIGTRDRSNYEGIPFQQPRASIVHRIGVRYWILLWPSFDRTALGDIRPKSTLPCLQRRFCNFLRRMCLGPESWSAHCLSILGWLGC